MWRRLTASKAMQFPAVRGHELQNNARRVRVLFFSNMKGDLMAKLFDLLIEWLLRRRRRAVW
jgi:hypothetical protein